MQLPRLFAQAVAFMLEGIRCAWVCKGNRSTLEIARRFGTLLPDKRLSPTRKENQSTGAVHRWGLLTAD